MINLSLNQPPSLRLGFTNFDIDAVMNTQYFEKAPTRAFSLLKVPPFCSKCFQTSIRFHKVSIVNWYIQGNECTSPNILFL